MLVLGPHSVTVISLVTTLRPKPIEMAVDLCVRHLPTPPSLGAVHSELIPSENIVPILICRTYFFKHKKKIKHVVDETKENICPPNHDKKLF